MMIYYYASNLQFHFSLLYNLTIVLFVLCIVIDSSLILSQFSFLFLSL